MRRNLIILILPVLFSGCAHTIKYKLTASDRWMGPKIDGVVCVQPFVDKTIAINSEEENIGEKTWRTNYRKGYADTNLSSEVTAMTVKHMAYSGLFAKVVTGKDTNADYALSGNLADFQTHGSINHGAETIQMVSAGFGLIGAVVGVTSTSGMKSEIKTSVKLDDLKLTDKAGQVVWQDTVSISNDITTHFDGAGQAAIFNWPDQALRDGVNEMIRSLGDSSLTNHTSAVTR